MNDTLGDDDGFHPNWVALATVKFKPKIFVRSSGTEDTETTKTKEGTSRIDIDESAKEVYEEILNMPSTVKKPKPQLKQSHTRKKRRKIEKVQFDKQKLFKLALTDDAEGIHELFLTSSNPDVNAIDAFGWTALMMSACEGSLNAFQKLLTLGADLSIADKKGDTAASLAHKKGFREIQQVITEFNRHCIEISDDEDNQHDEGAQFCSDCGIDISRSSSKAHQTSTVHLFSCKFKGNMNYKTFGITRSNRGFQIMRRTGWDGESALGARQTGKLYPIKTVIRKTRSGLGVEQESAKITHFKANDPSAVHFRPVPRAPSRKEIQENDFKDKRREQRLRRDLS